MEKISDESLYHLKSVAQPVAWQDLIFFIETIADKETNGYQASVVSRNVHTEEKKQWGNGGTAYTGLQLSPDSRWLSYLSNANEEKKMQVVLVPLDGGSPFALTSEKEGVSRYLWTADSAAVYYQTTVPAEEKEQPETEKKQPQPVFIDKLTYKQDGTGLLPQNKKHQIKKISIAAKENSLVFEQEDPSGLAYVAKDESFILLSRDLVPGDEWAYGETVYRYDVAAKTLTNLTAAIPKGSFFFGAMSEQEDYALLIGNDFRFAFVSQNKIYGLDMHTLELTCLTADQDLEVGDVIVADFQQNVTGVDISWLNDNEFVYPVTEHGKITLYIGNRQGQNRLVFDQPLHLTDGSLLKGSSRMAVTYSTPVLPSALAYLDLENHALLPVYDPNSAYFQEHSVVQPESFWYRGADDWNIQGWYLPPAEKREKHPAILYIHGGPQVCYGESFFHEMQVLAAQGYGVILLNPRGGNGYGQEFVASILGDYGNKDFQDLMLGTDAVLAAHPEIDPGRLYVAGGSYGGFMTNWTVGHTDRFRAAVTSRSISNWISFYGTSDVGAFFVEFQLQRDLSDAEGLWRMSPLAYAQQVKTPLLVLHGQEDLRCPQEQGEQMYIAMKKQKVDTKLITFPQSSHGLSREGLPNLRLARVRETLKWFEEHP